MKALELLRNLESRGIEFQAAGDRLRFRPSEVLTPEDLDGLRQHKPEILAALRGETLPSPAEVADDVDACLRLGQRLKRGEITAVRCGITGKRCTGCQGVPCLGSIPWEESYKSARWYRLLKAHARRAADDALDGKGARCPSRTFWTHFLRVKR